jgi:hypothetical protein
MFESRSWCNVVATTLCDKVCQWLATGRWFSPGTPVSSTNKTDGHDITEIFLKVVFKHQTSNGQMMDQTFVYAVHNIKHLWVIMWELSFVHQNKGEIVRSPTSINVYWKLISLLRRSKKFSWYYFWTIPKTFFAWYILKLKKKIRKNLLL